MKLSPFVIILLIFCIIGFYIGTNSYILNKSREEQLINSKNLLREIQNNTLNANRLAQEKNENKTELQSLFQTCTNQVANAGLDILQLNQFYVVLNYYDQLNSTITEINRTCNEEINRLNQTLNQIQPKSIQITNFTNAGLCQIISNGTFKYVQFSHKTIKMGGPIGISMDYFVFNSLGGLNFTYGLPIEIYGCSPPIFTSAELFPRAVLTQDGFLGALVSNVQVGQGKVRINHLTTNGTFILENWVVLSN